MRGPNIKGPERASDVATLSSGDHGGLNGSDSHSR